MQIDKQCILEIAEAVSKSVVVALKEQGLVGSPSANPKMEKTAYQKTEQLLHNYMRFKEIIAESVQEIEELRKYGVPQSCGAGGERVQNGNLPHGIVLPEESVESAVHTVQKRVQGIVQAIALIDKCMGTLKNDPYYNVLEWYYFERRTLEDIGLEYNCSAMNISKTRSRLVKELSLKLFPNQVVAEMMN